MLLFHLEKINISAIKEKLNKLEKEYKRNNSISYTGGYSKKIRIAFIFLILIFLYLTLFAFKQINSIPNSPHKIIILINISVIVISIYSIISILREKIIKKITFSNNILYINIASMKEDTEYNFNLKDYIFTTKRVITYDQDHSAGIQYYLIFTNKYTKKIEQLKILPKKPSIDYYAFIIYIKLIVYNLELISLTDQDLNQLYNDCNNANNNFFDKIV